MKKVIIIIFALIGFNLTAQITIQQICTGVDPNQAVPNTYFADLEGTFDNFIGEWKYTSGTEVLTVKITKVTQYYFPEYHIYKDFLVGDYKYSTDGGQPIW